MRKSTNTQNNEKVGNTFFTPVYTDIFDTEKTEEEHDVVREGELFYDLLTQKKRIVLSFTQAMDSVYISDRLINPASAKSFKNLCDRGLITIGEFSQNRTECLSDYICERMDQEIQRIDNPGMGADSFHFSSMPFLNQMPASEKRAAFTYIKDGLSGRHEPVPALLANAEDIKKYVEQMRELNDHIAVRKEGNGQYRDITFYLEEVMQRLDAEEKGRRGLTGIAQALCTCNLSRKNRSSLYAYVEEEAGRYGYGADVVAIAKVMVDIAYNNQVGSSLGVAVHNQFRKEYGTLFHAGAGEMQNRNIENEDLFRSNLATWEYLDNFTKEVCNVRSEDRFHKCYDNRMRDDNIIYVTRNTVEFGIEFLRKLAELPTIPGMQGEATGSKRYDVLANIVSTGIAVTGTVLNVYGRFIEDKITELVYNLNHKEANYGRMTWENIMIGKSLDEEFGGWNINDK